MCTVNLWWYVGNMNGEIQLKFPYSDYRLKLECEKLAGEKTEMQRHYVMVSQVGGRCGDIRIIVHIEVEPSSILTDMMCSGCDMCSQQLKCRELYLHFSSFMDYGIHVSLWSEQDISDVNMQRWLMLGSDLCAHTAQTIPRRALEVWCDHWVVRPVLMKTFCAWWSWTWVEIELIIYPSLSLSLSLVSVLRDVLRIERGNAQTGEEIYLRVVTCQRVDVLGLI